jgi:hypothetical protein
MGANDGMSLESSDKGKPAVAKGEIPSVITIESKIRVVFILLIAGILFFQKCYLQKSF